MSPDRRKFVVAAAGVAALHPVNMIAAARDPLGVRDDFPIVAEHIYLNSAYIAPVSRAVVAAGRAYIEGKSGRPMQVGALMAACDAVRVQFARMVNATPEEIGLLNSTGEGENVIANGVGRGPEITWWLTTCITPRSSFCIVLWRRRGVSSYAS